MNLRLLITFQALLAMIPSLSSADVHREQVGSPTELHALLKHPVDSLEITLQPGHYHLSPAPIIDSTCGNCQNPEQPVAATAGLQIAGDYVRLCGPQDHSAVIHTNAGYGIFFKRCKTGIIENLSVTGGVRDADGKATDAAIVVKNSAVTIRHCRIFDNIGDSSMVVKNVVGIIGVCGRENSHVTIVDNEITGNSWDGIALYRDAGAIIADNLIDGVDQAGANIAGGGRGVGIGVTWNARATIEGNLVKRYWKGIGIFVDAQVTARHNIIEDILTWGIAYWDADQGAPVAFLEDNIIYSTGACGISIHRSTPGSKPGHLTSNLIVKTAQNPKYDSPDYYCDQCALSISAKPDNFAVVDNLFFDNRRATEDLPDYDMSANEFKRLLQTIRDRLSTRPRLEQSDFAKYLFNQ